MIDDSALITQAKAGDNAAKTALLQKHNGFIYSRVKRYCRNAQDFDDYISIAQMGFLKAIDKYDPAFDCALIGYARHWIDQNLRRYREADHTVKPAYNRAQRFQRREALGEYDGTRADARRSEYDQQLRSEVFSLDVPRGETGEDWIEIIQSSTPTPETQLEQAQEVDLLKRRLRGMDRRTVATLLRGDSTLQEVGAPYRVSRERIRQIQNQGLAHMRRVYGSNISPG